MLLYRAMNRPHYTLTDFDYTLPESLIAQRPLKNRTDSRLMRVNPKTGAITHHLFADLPQLIQAKDALIFNNTEVIPARLWGQKQSGGKIECLIERVLSDDTVLAQIRASKSPKDNSLLNFSDAVSAKVLGREGEFFILEFLTKEPIYSILDQYGHLPLPPYITQSDQVENRTRYQTVYAKHKGAVAAPTAGLHFDQAVLAQLKAQGNPMAEVTLHVGAGTFSPIRVEDIRLHQMHREQVIVDELACERVNHCKGRVIAVGTTSVRCLESAYKEGALRPFVGDTQIFIYPGFEFQCVQGLITNFHLPKSSLLMLVSALAGYDLIREAYQIAIQEQYRFFSYGDAMLILG